MVSSGWQIILIFLAIILSVEFAVQTPIGKKIENIIPRIFWIYFIPMLLSVAGVFPEENSIFSFLKSWGLLFALFLLIVPTNLKKLWRMGLPALLVMLVGSLGVVFGAILLYALMQPWLPRDSWQMIGPLAGSWIGGSLNMVAVAQAYGIANEAYSPIVIVDTILGYSWMAVLLLGAGRQKQINRWLYKNSSSPSSEPLSKQKDFSFEADPSTKRSGLFLKLKASLEANLSLAIIWLFFWMLFFSSMSLYFGKIFPSLNGWIPSFAWTIILITIFSLAAGKIVLADNEFLHKISDSTGSLLLYLILAAIGAQSDFSSLQGSLALFIFGILWLLIHGLFIFLAARWLKQPVAMLATASQCNIGGVVSGPIVAESYQKGFAPVALLMAVMGNIYGFYFALFVTTILKKMS